MTQVCNATAANDEKEPRPTPSRASRRSQTPTAQRLSLFPTEWRLSAQQLGHGFLAARGQHEPALSLGKHLLSDEGLDCRTEVP